MKTFRDYLRTHKADDGVVLQTLPVAARAMQGERAGFFTRVIAAIIDVVITGAIMFAAWVAGWLFLLVFSPAEGYTLPQPGYFLLSGYLILWLYWTWFWATSGRSPGQSLMGVRVLGRNDHHPGWGMAAVRSAFCVVFPIGIGWIVVSRRNRSVQDVVLRTSVIHDWSSRIATGKVAPLETQQKAVQQQQSTIEEKAERVADSIGHVAHHRTADGATPSQQSS